MTPHTDLPHMRRALQAAHEALFLSDPNPRVGCVLLNAAGELIGVGHTQQVGGPHAEVMALRDAASRGASTVGGTAYVTLEPCSHHGRTPPCADALVAAGLARVVVAVGDPNPLVAGQGVARLRATGIQVDIGLLADEAREINIGFFSRMARKRPWVRLKVAASLDGLTALADGRSQWITGEAARADGHRFRAQASAVLTGVGTVMADDPQLTVRGIATPRQPRRVIVDSRLSTPPAARVLAQPESALIYTARPDAPRAAALLAAGATLITCAAADGRVDLAAMLSDLVRREVNELHVEAGAALNGSLLQQGLVDELLVYLAPKLLAQGRGMWQMPAPADLAQARPWAWHCVERVGDDLRLQLRRL